MDKQKQIISQLLNLQSIIRNQRNLEEPEKNFISDYILSIIIDVKNLEN